MTLYSLYYEVDIAKQKVVLLKVPENSNTIYVSESYFLVQLQFKPNNNLPLKWPSLLACY